MKSLYPVLLLLVFCTNADAQTPKPDRQSRRAAALQPHAKGRVSAKLNIFGLFDPETPTIQPGIELRFSQRLSGEFTVGIPVRIHGNVRNTDSTYNRYYKLKAELRYFPLERRSFYLAPELSYISKERSRYNGVFVGKDQETYGYDYAEVDKSVIAMAFKIGAIVPFKKNHRWFMDVFFGVGPRFVQMDLNAVNRRTDHAPWMFWRSDKEGSTTGLHLTTGIKIGHVLY